MIKLSEKFRIKIGLGLVIVLSMVMLINNVQQTLTIKRLEQANRQLTLRCLHVPVARHPSVKHA